MKEYFLRYNAPLLRAGEASDRVILGCVASEGSLDSHGSVIKSSGWDLSRYSNNPILLWNHKSADEPENILGTALVYLGADQLLADLHFSPMGANAKADMVWGQVERGEVRGLSVGFRPKSYHFESRDSGDDTLVIDEAELVELSVVSVPSNPNTLISQIRSFELEESNSMGAENGNGVEKREASIMSEGYLPKKLSELLGVSGVDEAERVISEYRLRIEQLETKLERAELDAKELRQAADVAVAELREHRDSVADASVEELVQLGIIKESSREVAKVFARQDLAKFNELYKSMKDEAASRGAPRSYLLENLVQNRNEKKAVEKPLSDVSARMRSLKAKFMAENPRLGLAEAYQMAVEELDKGAK